MIRIAQLDGDGRLVGYRNVKKAKPTDVAVGDDCDLPADGSYKWTGRAFLPLGHGFGKPARPPVADNLALYLFMRAAMDGTPVPDECRQWADWYRDNLLQRQEEAAAAAAVRQRRLAGKPRRTRPSTSSGGA